MEQLLAEIKRLSEGQSLILDMLKNHTPPSPAKSYFSPKEVVQILYKEDLTVREWCRLKRIHSEKGKCNKRVRIPMEEVVRLQQNGCVLREKGTGIQTIVPE